ncbi:MAG: hypothetical protein KDA84_26570 [Planctomycetaceae bacterium]|nr:hypothetical protein [Planctomycetaceae bacterium]
MMNFDELNTEAESLNEHNDCAVKAVAVAAGVSYQLAHDTLKANGRKDRKRTKPYMTFVALSDLGFTCHQIQVKAKTVRTIEKELNPNLVYLIKTRGHVLAYRDGRIQDWTQGRLHRIKAVYLVRESCTRLSTPETPHPGSTDLSER